MCDESEQADEIMALKSIYESDVFCCDETKNPLHGEIKAHLQEFSGPFNILCQGEELSLKCLPPIVVNFSLPSDYPLSNPPHIALSCVWMSSEQLESVSNKLIDQWKECPSVILFTWINFLQVDVIEFLEIKFPIRLSQDDFVEVMQYNYKKEEEDFKRSIQECPVCFCQKAGTQCLRLSNCGHIFCKECLSDYLAVRIKEGSAGEITCPGEKCEAHLYHSVIKELVSQNDFERYEYLTLQKSLELMSDVVYCPRIKCGKPVVIENSDSLGKCQACDYAFCVYCRTVYHGVNYCQMNSDETEKLKEKYSLADYEEKARMEKVYGRRRLKELVEGQATISWIKANSRACPSCKASIEKSDGCNKMLCLHCDCKFCWLCMKKIDRRDPYLHYSDKDSPCFNNLFVERKS